MNSMTLFAKVLFLGRKKQRTESSVLFILELVSCSHTSKNAAVNSKKENTSVPMINLFVEFEMCMVEAKNYRHIPEFSWSQMC